MKMSKMWARGMAAVLALGLAAGSIQAGNDAAADGSRKGREKELCGECGRTGKGGAPHGRAMGRKAGMPGMMSEALKQEMERFQGIMQGIKDEMEALRDKVNGAIEEAHEGDGKPTPEMIKAAVEPYKADAEALANRICDERIQHNENVLSILKNDKPQMVDGLTKSLLSQKTGHGKMNMGKCGKGQKCEGNCGGNCGKKGEGSCSNKCGKHGEDAEDEDLDSLIKE